MKKFSTIIASFVAGILFATAASSFAAVGDKVEALFANFNFIVNGKAVVPSETPLVYNGTSYLPVRSLANLIGMDVTYKSDSKTIVLTSVTDVTYGSSPSTSTGPTEPVPPQQNNFPEVILYKGFKALRLNGNIYFYKDQFVNIYVFKGDGSPKEGKDFQIDQNTQIANLTFDEESYVIDLKNKDDAIIYDEQIFLSSKFYPKKLN